MAELVTKYQQYDEYKESGVEWLGEIPSHWGLVSTKRVIQEHSGNGFPIELQDDENGIIPFLKVSDISGEETYIHKCSHRVTLENIKKYKWNVVPKGSIVTGKIGEALKKNHRKILLEDSIIDNNCIAIESTGISNIFNFYVHRVIDFDWYVNPGAVPSISVQKYKAETLAIPTNSEQTQIANFLDYETAQIDTLIDKQQTLIQLLKEKRQAVISHAVTKGLNPDAPMKDSGVEWLGEVPKHWNIVKLSYRMKLLSGDGITSQDIEPTGQYPVYGGNGLRGYTDRYNCEGHHVLIGRQGALCGNINLAQGKFFATEHAVVVYPYQDFNISFLSEFLRFMDLGQYSVSAAQPGISVERINGLKILVPPYYEQTEIDEHVENIIKRFEDLSTKANQQIKLLQERRTALISAAVTGKIDVRGWRASE